MIKVRFYIAGQENPVQDHDMVAAPRFAERVELAAGDGSPIPFIVDRVTWIPHDVIPADVVIELIEISTEGRNP